MKKLIRELDMDTLRLVSRTPIDESRRKLITAIGFLRLRALREGVDFEQEIALILDAAVALDRACTTDIRSVSVT